MRLACFVEPTDDLPAACRRWAEAGLRELWRPDPDTVVFGADGRAAVLIENHPVELALGPGPMFVVRSVVEQRALHPDVSWLVEPCEVPAGRYAAFRVEPGSTVRLLDLTGSAPERTVFEPDPA